MTQKLLAEFLSARLSRVFADVNEDQVTTSLWNGELTLTNLSFNPDLFGSFINVTDSKVGKVVISIPWKTLVINPCTIHVTDVSINLLVPTE